MKTLLLMLSLAVTVPGQTSDPAIVYFYRVEEIGKLDSRKVSLKLEGKKLLDMPEDNFIAFKIPAGDYELRMRQKQSEMLLRVESGKRYFIRVSQVEAGYGFNQSLSLTSEDQAAFQMRAMRPLEDKNIKNKNLMITREKPPLNLR